MSEYKENRAKRSKSLVSTSLLTIKKSTKKVPSELTEQSNSSVFDRETLIINYLDDVYDVTENSVIMEKTVSNETVFEREDLISEYRDIGVNDKVSTRSSKENKTSDPNETVLDLDQLANEFRDTIMDHIDRKVFNRDSRQAEFNEILSEREEFTSGYENKEQDNKEIKKNITEKKESFCNDLEVSGSKNIEMLIDTKNSIGSFSLSTDSQSTESVFKLQDLIRQPNIAVEEKARGGFISKTNLNLHKKELDLKPSKIHKDNFYKGTSRVDFGLNRELLNREVTPSMINIKESEEGREPVSRVFSIRDCGEPLKSQNLIIDFTPVKGEDNSEFVLNKCCSFWKFIEENKQLHHLQVFPEIDKETEKKRKGSESSIESITELHRTTKSCISTHKPVGLSYSAYQKLHLKPKKHKTSKPSAYELLPESLKTLKVFEENSVTKLVFDKKPPAACKPELNADEGYFDNKKWTGTVVKKKDTHVLKSSFARISSLKLVRQKTQQKIKYHSDDLAEIMAEMDNFDERCPRSLEPPGRPPGSNVEELASSYTLLPLIDNEKSGSQCTDCFNNFSFTQFGNESTFNF